MGKIYLKWSQFVLTILKGKGKLGHLNGAEPKDGDPNLEHGMKKINLIVAGSQNSMNTESSGTIMFLNKKNICNAIEQTYSEAKTAAQVYALKVKTVAAKREKNLSQNMPTT